MRQLGLICLCFTLLNGCTAKMQDCYYEHTQMKRAWHAWMDYSDCTPNCNKDADYRDGWKAGYYDVLVGNPGTPPLVPPKKYWKPSEITVSRDKNRHQWYVGFQDGANCAKQQPDTHYLKLWTPPEACPVPAHHQHAAPFIPPAAPIESFQPAPTPSASPVEAVEPAEVEALPATEAAPLPMPAETSESPLTVPETTPAAPVEPATPSKPQPYLPEEKTPLPQPAGNASSAAELPGLYDLGTLDSSRSGRVMAPVNPFANVMPVSVERPDEVVPVVVPAARPVVEPRNGQADATKSEMLKGRWETYQNSTESSSGPQWQPRWKTGTDCGSGAASKVNPFEVLGN